MHPMWAQRREEVLRDCIVSPDVFTQIMGSIQNTCQNRSQATLRLNRTCKNNRFEMLNFRRENSVSRWISN